MESPLRERWKDVVEVPEKPVVKLRVWIEKTIVRGRADREQGEYALGKMLWSPKQSTSGGDIYRFMRDVQPVGSNPAPNRQRRLHGHFGCGQRS